MLTALKQWLKKLFPLKSVDLPKFLPLFLMLGLICFNHNILRNLKDTLIITAKESNAEAIPFLKMWAILPMAILVTWIFTRLSWRYDRTKVFVLMVSSYLAYYLLFAFVLYPLRDILHPHTSADYLQSILPRGFKGLIALYRNWTYTSFYIMSELWGTVAMDLLFWSFANEITRIGEAKRYYGLLQLGGNVSGILAGYVGILVGQHLSQQAVGQTTTGGWDYTLKSLVLAVTLSGIAIIALYLWTHKRVAFQAEESAEKFEPKQRISFRNALSIVARNRYLFCIATMVVSYSLVINVVEVLWKEQVRLLYPNPNDFNIFLNRVTMMVGAVSTLTSLFMATILHRKGWTFAALITPAIMTITAAGFFTFLLLPDTLAMPTLNFLHTTPLAIAVLFGAAHNTLCKGAKYSVFDASKEMAFIPLDKHIKLKGKAAIDGVGSRLGKSGGAFILQGLCIAFQGLGAVTPFIAALVGGVLIAWFSAVRSLGQRFTSLTNKEEVKTAAIYAKDDKPVSIQEAL